jgi:hypothetical protein
LGLHWDSFFTDCELRDLLDSITLIHDSILATEGIRSAIAWRGLIARIFREENVRYQIDDDGIVHFSVDEEFERARLASLSVLQEPRYQNVRALFERVYLELDKVPPDGKEAIRATFAALEGLFRIMFDRANRLGSDEIQTYLQPYLERKYAGQMPALNASQKMARSFKEWVTGAHFYRHEQGQEEVVQPPIELAIATVSSGAAYLRWLAELDRNRD